MLCCVLACCCCLQVETVADYDLYCHYVAGLVGVGLSQLFGEQQLVTVQRQQQCRTARAAAAAAERAAVGDHLAQQAW
jgi:phytoene/squalene synthetase